MAGKAGKFVYIVGQFCAQIVVEKLAYLLFGFVNGGHHDVGGFFACHLHDKFAQIAFHRAHAFAFQMVVEFNLFAHHRFALHHQLGVVRFHDAVDDLLRFFHGFRPMHAHAEAGEIVFQLHQQIGQFGQRVLANVLAQRAQHLQFFFVRQHQFALGHQHIHGGAQAFTQRFVGKRGFGVLLEGFGARVDFDYLRGHTCSSKSAGLMCSGNTASTTKSRGPCAPNAKVS